MNRKNIVTVVAALIAVSARAQSFEDQLNAAAQAAVRPVASDHYLYKMAVRAQLKSADCGATPSEISSLFGQLKAVPHAQVAVIRAQEPAADGSCALLVLARVLPDDFPELKAALPDSNAISDPEYAGMVEYAVKSGRLAAFGKNEHDLNGNATPHWFIPEPSTLPGSIVGAAWNCSQRYWGSDMSGDSESTMTWTFRLNPDKSVAPPFVPSYNQGRTDRFYLISGKTVYFFWAGQEGVFRDVGYGWQEFTSASAARLEGPDGVTCLAE